MFLGTNSGKEQTQACEGSSFTMKALVFLVFFFVSCSNGFIDVTNSNALENKIIEDLFSISVDAPKVEANVDETTNFTIAIDKLHWGAEEIEVTM